VLGEDLCIETALTTLARQLSMTNLVVGLTQLDEAMYRRPAETPNLAVGSYIQTAWIDVEGTFASYWEGRGKNLRQNMRKQRRKLGEDGIVARLEVLRDKAGVAEAIEAYGQLEAAGWKAAGGTAIHSDNSQGRFYREMLERFCSNGRGCIFRYYFDDRVVAVDLCIESNDVLVILKTTYDESIKLFSPAFLMREEAFARIWQEGRIKRIEFFGKLMDWHKRWTENTRDIYHLTHYRWSWIKRLRSQMKPPASPQSQVALSVQE
jgi:CelD/BcsL family acetyltransferase involved in cellulose biosynthesis